MNKSISPLGMMHQLFVDAKPYMKLILLFIFMVVSSIIIVSLAGLIAMPVFSMPFDLIQESMNEGFRYSSAAMIRFFQAFNTAGMFIIPAILANSFLLNKEDNYFRIKRHNYFLIILLLVLILIAALPFIQFLISLNENMNFPSGMESIRERLTEMEDDRLLLSERMLADSGTGSIIINFLVIAILPALGEEFFFRGVFQKLLHNWIGNVHVAIILTGAVFSAFHLQFFGFIPRMILGIYFGYLFIWSGNIWLAVLAHFLNNALALIIIYSSDMQIIKENAWLAGTAEVTMLSLICSMIITTAIVFLIRRVMIKSG